MSPANPQQAMVQVGAVTVNEVNLALTLLCKWINELGETQVTSTELATALPQPLDTTDSPTFLNLALTALSPGRLIAKAPAGTLASIRDLMEYMYGTNHQILLDNSAGDGTIIVKTPQNIDTDSDTTFNSLTAGSGGNTAVLDNTGIHLFGTATQWDDSMVPPFDARTAAANLALQSFSGGLYAPRYDVNDEIFSSIQLPHRIKTTDTVTITPHIHLINKTAIGATNYKVKFEFEYGWSNIGSTGLSTTANDPLNFSFENVDAYTHKMFNFTDIVAGAGQGGISSLFVFRLKRVAADDHAYNTNDIFFGGFDLHFEVDALGSNSPTSK